MKAFVSSPVEMPEIFHEGTSVPGGVSEAFLPWRRCWETKALRAPTAIRNVVVCPCFMLPALQEKGQKKDQDDDDNDKGKVHPCIACYAKICV